MHFRVDFHLKVLSFPQNLYKKMGIIPDLQNLLLNKIRQVNTFKIS